MDCLELRNTAAAAAAVGSKILKAKFLGVTRVLRKGARDLTTEVDLEVEQAIRAVILRDYPDHAFLGEEMGQAGNSSITWIIDPLDGTFNFVYGIPFFAISIAAVSSDRTLVGVICDPLRDELFVAEDSRGVWLNGEAVSVSSRNPLSEAMVAVELPYESALDTNYLDVFAKLRATSRDIRRLGSTVLSLAYLACGRLDVFVNLAARPWDISAGCLIVKEAGGLVAERCSTVLRPTFSEIVATNQALHAAVLAVLGDW